MDVFIKDQANSFQFTHPGRGATVTFWTSLVPYLSFNSRTPGGVRLRGDDLTLARCSSFNSCTPGGVRR